MPDIEPSCNVCGHTEFRARGDRPFTNCLRCGANERTRIIRLVMERMEVPREGQRVLHLAPENSTARFLMARLGDDYEMADLNPELFPWSDRVRRLDLIEDAESLPDEHYDLILHSHVMEHLPGNVWAVLYHLHRSLKPSGMQICCIPIMGSKHYEESFEALSAEEATRRFGQFDHVRRFGGKDIQRTLGMLFDLPETYDLTTTVPAETLRQHGIEERLWRGWNPNSVLALPKAALKLRSQGNGAAREAGRGSEVSARSLA